MNYKDEILKLRSEGKTYKEICLNTGASKSTVSYYCGKNQKEKAVGRTRGYRKNHPFYAKINSFKFSGRFQKSKCIPKNNSEYLLYHKIYKFHSREKTGRNNMNEKFGIKEVIKLIGEKPTCYLTGLPIDINDTQSYHFDHKVPVSRGGSNTLDNLGICTKESNQAKSDSTIEEFLELCKKVLVHHGYLVVEKL